MTSIEFPRLHGEEAITTLSNFKELNETEKSNEPQSKAVGLVLRLRPLWHRVKTRVELLRVVDYGW